MDIIEFLKKIQLEEKYLSYFKKAFILQANHYSNLNVTVISIKTPKILPAEVYRNLREKLAKFIGTEIELVIEPEDSSLNTVELNYYINYYKEISGIRLADNLIPVIDDKHIVVAFNSDEDREMFSSFIKNAGCNYPLTDKPLNKDIKAAPRRVVSSPNGNGSSSPFPQRRKAQGNDASINREEYLKVPMSMLKGEMDKIQVTGKVFAVEYQSMRNKMEIQKISMTDYNDAVIIKRFESRALSHDELHSIEEGAMYTVYGKYRYDEYERKDIIEPVLMEKLDYDPYKREDNYEGTKHIDLHVHTNRTEMDGICECKELINQAYAFGQKAIAITDINVVQAYPKMQEAHIAINKKDPDNDFKVIYGIEMKMADDSLRVVFNPSDQKVRDVEYAVLDLETTGLSTKYDHIIEFGGIIVRNNTISEDSPRLQKFIKPPVRLPSFIEQKTNITNEMVEYAETLKEAIDEILDFIGDRVIVAHNADFDFNFLNEKLIEMGREPLKNVCLDTLNLAKILVTNRKYYRLGLIAKNYGVIYDDDEAHRGDYDAEVLANILIKMLPTLPGYPDVTFNDIQNRQPEDIYKKARTYNVTLLARNMAGIKDLYKLVSLAHTDYLTYFAKENAKKADSDVVAEPRIIRKEIEKYRKNLFVGSCNLYSELFENALIRSDADVSRVMDFYDYVEVQPISCYTPEMEEGTSVDEKRLEEVVKTIIRIADEKGKMVVANNDVYYTHPYQKIGRDIYIMAKRIGGSRHPLYPLRRERRLHFVAPDQHLMTTEEMLKAFSFLSEEKAREIVCINPKLIADQIEKLYPIPQELHTPSIDGCEELLTQEIFKNAYNTYGNPLPEIVKDRIDKELNSVITNGFSVQYYIAYLLVKRSNEEGYIVGSRGSVGSSFIATMANITEVNPLVPHYVCPDCKHSEFFTNNEYANGFDLPVKKCPVCGKEMIRNGHDIPFETFLGFKGDKVPDIDLNFAEENQNTAQLQIKEIFGENYAYRAGTIGTVALKTAYGYVKGYYEEIEKLTPDGRPDISSAYMDYLSHLCEGVKRTTGQHPGGIVVIPKENDVYDFSPIQHPANDPFSDWLTTHFAFSDLHDNILKLDILGHVDPRAIRLLQLYIGIDARDIPMNDPKAISLFSSTRELKIKDPKGRWAEKNGAAGLPEFGTRNNRNILDQTKPTTFAELVSLSGLTHGTNVWANNAELLIRTGVCTLKDVIACRDDIMTYLISKNLESKESFDIMESVRKGRGLKENWIEDMRDHDVPEWYIDSCEKIQYMFPKAHAVAYVMMAMRIAWCKVYYPAEYYAVYFSVRCDAYDIETMIKGEDATYAKLNEVRARLAADPRNKAKKDEDLENTLEIAMEMFLRGYRFSNISLKRSEATNFIVDPDDPKAIIPSFSSVDGLGDNVGRSIVEARKEHEFLSKEDLQKRTQVNNTQLAFLDRIGVLDELSDEDQLSLF